MKKKLLGISACLISYSSIAYSDSKIIAVILNKGLNDVHYIVDESSLTNPTSNPNFIQMFDTGYKMALDNQGNVWEANGLLEWSKTNMDNVSKISVSGLHALALKTNGDVFVKGANDDGQLGLGHENFVSDWTLSIQGASDIEASGGDDYCQEYGNSFVIKNNKLLSVGIGSWHTLARPFDNSIAGCDGQKCNTWGDTGLVNPKAIASSFNNVYALDNNGVIYKTGYQQWDVDGTPNNIGFERLIAAPHHIYAIKSNEIYGRGTNNNGQLGIGNTSWQNNFVKGSSLTSPDDIIAWGNIINFNNGGGFAIKNNELYVVGNNNNGGLGIPESEGVNIVDWHKTSLTNVTHIYGGFENAFIKDDGMYKYPMNGEFIVSGISIDSDNDGVPDYREVIDGTDPNNDQDYQALYLHPRTGIENVVISKSSKYIDSGGENNYNNNEDGTITFTSNDSSRLKVTFDSFKTEGGYDTFYIYDGNNKSAPLVKQCENSECDGYSFTSTGDSLTFYFESDNAYIYAGWKGNIDLVN